MACYYFNHEFINKYLINFTAFSEPMLIAGGLSRMISDAFLNKIFCINILILIAFTKQILNLMYLYILIWKRQVATNDIKSVR